MSVAGSDETTCGVTSRGTNVRDTKRSTYHIRVYGVDVVDAKYVLDELRACGRSHPQHLLFLVIFDEVISTRAKEVGTEDPPIRYSPPASIKW